MIELMDRESFKAAAGRHGFNEEDFMVRKDLDARLPTHEYPTHGSVTVTLRRTGVMRTYCFGDGKGWVPDFEKDLEGKVFA